MPQSRTGRWLLLIGASYLLGCAYVGIGGMLWQAGTFGWARTNVGGYLTWCWVYGLLYGPINAVAAFACFRTWVRGVAPPRGFGVVTPRAKA